VNAVGARRSTGPAEINHVPAAQAAAATRRVGPTSPPMYTAVAIPARAFRQSRSVIERAMSTARWCSPPRASMFDASLRRLDVYLLHQPAPADFEDTVAAYLVAEKMLQAGRARAIGVYNFSPDHSRGRQVRQDARPGWCCAGTWTRAAPRCPSRLPRPGSPRTSTSSTSRSSPGSQQPDVGRNHFAQLQVDHITRDQLGQVG
jgi:hypothetical protein